MLRIGELGTCWNPRSPKPARPVEILDRRPLPTLLLVALFAGCDPSGTAVRVQAPADTVAGEIAFELAGPGGAALVVPAWVNGEGPFDFVLDTGATFTCVEVGIARRLELPEARGVVGVGAGVGAAGQLQLVRIDSLRVGEAHVEGLTGCALDLAHMGAVGIRIDGLLGLNFLRNFRVTVDFEREVLLLQGRD
jgi:predicted aspartyl protease